MNDPRGTSAILVSDQSVARLGRHVMESSLTILLLMLVCLLGGCTTLRPIDVNAVTLHQKIRSGDAVKAGDTIRAITSDGVAHLLLVTEVNEKVIEGHPPGARADVTETVLPIDDIVLVEVSRLSTDNPKRFATGTGIGVVVGLVIIGILVLLA
jgi:hypothetical protein